ncbi:hypothetical protein DMUE_2807 [Dictyocoela muelleri]|nr:hypothetical protein DMUE_2807 [Dictyocoela muelleri]
MFISSSALDKFISEKNETTIISNKENKKFVKKLYDYLKNKFPEKEIYLQSTTNVACRLKLLESESFILLCAACPFHVPENCFFSKKNGFNDNIFKDDINQNQNDIDLNQNDLKEKDKNRIYSDEQKGNINTLETYSDSFYIDPVEIDENELISYKFETPEINKIAHLKNDMAFMISRLAKIDKVKKSKRFAIFFTTFYLSLAEKVKKFIDRIGKGYLYHMRNYRECAEGNDCVIVIDCPLFFPFDYNVISPYELCMAFEWSGGYFFNVFKEPNIDFNTYGVSGDIVKYDRKFVTVDYENEESDYEIHEGFTGIPKNYK